MDYCEKRWFDVDKVLFVEQIYTDFERSQIYAGIQEDKRLAAVSKLEKAFIIDENKQRDYEEQKRDKDPAFLLRPGVEYVPKEGVFVPGDFTALQALRFINTHELHNDKVIDLNFEILYEITVPVLDFPFLAFSSFLYNPEDSNPATEELAQESAVSEQGELLAVRERAVSEQEIGKLLEAMREQRAAWKDFEDTDEVLKSVIGKFVEKLSTELLKHGSKIVDIESLKNSVLKSLSARIRDGKLLYDFILLPHREGTEPRTLTLYASQVVEVSEDNSVIKTLKKNSMGDLAAELESVDITKEDLKDYDNGTELNEEMGLNLSEEDIEFLDRLIKKLKK